MQRQFDSERRQCNLAPKIAIQMCGLEKCFCLTHYQYTGSNSHLDQGLEMALVAKRIPILGHFWSFHPIKQGSIFLLSGRVLCYLTNFISCDKSQIDHSMKYYLPIEMANHQWIRLILMKQPFLTPFYLLKVILIVIELI